MKHNILLRVMLIMYQLTTLPWLFNLMDDKTLKSADMFTDTDAINLMLRGT